MEVRKTTHNVVKSYCPQLKSQERGDLKQGESTTLHTASTSPFTEGKLQHSKLPDIDLDKLLNLKKKKGDRASHIELNELTVNVSFQAPNIIEPRPRKLKFENLKIYHNKLETRNLIIEEPENQEKLHIPFRKEGNYIYSPKQPLYDTFNLLAVLSEEVKMVEEKLGRKVEWGNSEFPKLHIKPHAGKMSNAYYAETLGGVKIFYTSYITPKAKAKIFRLSSDPDVATHEVGHALLDSIRDQYNESIYPETRAIHEAMADTFAFLTASRDEAVLDKMINSRGKLRTHGPLPLIGEASGPVFSYDTLYMIYSTFYPFNTFARFIRNTKDLVDNSIRTLENNFKYKPFHELKIRWKRKKGEDPIAFLRRIRKTYSGEEHSYSRVLSGAIWDVVKLEHAKRMRKQPVKNHSTGVTTLREITDELSNVIIRGLELAPVASPSFRELAMALLASDKLFNSGKLQDSLQKAFINRKILSESDIALLEKRMKLARQLEIELPKDLPELSIGKQRLLREGNSIKKVLLELLGGQAPQVSPEDKTKWEELKKKAMKVAHRALKAFRKVGLKLDDVGLKNLKFYELHRDGDGNTYLLYTYDYGTPILLAEGEESGKVEKYDMKAGLLLVFDKNGKLFYYDLGTPDLQKVRDTARYLNYLIKLEGKVKRIDQIRTESDLLNTALIVDEKGALHPTGVIVD